MTQKEKLQLLEKSISEYFEVCDKANRCENFNETAGKVSKSDSKPHKPYTMSGLLCHIGLTYKEFELLSENNKYRRLLYGAKSRIEAYIEEKSLTGELSSNASQASLKYYFGWGEKQEKEIPSVGEGTVIKVVLGDEAQSLAQ